MYCIHIESDIDRLKAENEYLNSLLTPEMRTALSINSEIQRLEQQKEKLNQEIQNMTSEKSKLNQQLDEIKQKIIILDDEMLYQDFGLYTPVYNLMNSEAYKDRIAVIRQQQKNMIKNNSAAFFPTNFTYNNSLAQGKKLVADNVKQILRAFNNECEAIIDKVKYNNVESIRKRIIKSCEDLNKLNSKIQISISPGYLDLKLQEMNLCYEYAMIFSDDAPALEAALHRAFDDRKVNMVNTRREFFHVTLEEIEEVVRKNYDKTVEFTKLPNAEQYRESQMIRKGLGQAPLSKIEPNDNFTQTVQSSHTTQAKTIKSNTTSAKPSTVKLDPNKEYLRTKWGIYEMPEHYTIKMSYGKRTDLKQVN